MNNQFWKNQKSQTNFVGNSQQSNQSQNFQTPNSKPEPSFMTKAASCLMPLLIEQFTGQSMPMGGNSVESQLTLFQILNLQQQIISSQQQLEQRLTKLETNATNQLTNLIQQVQSIKSIRLSHSKETKQLDYGLQNEHSPSAFGKDETN